jgi:hypothetical protein
MEGGLGKVQGLFTINDRGPERIEEESMHSIVIGTKVTSRLDKARLRLSFSSQILPGSLKSTL